MKKNNINGFTMIELLLVIGIFSVVMASVYSVFDSQHRSYLIQEEVASMQQNLRPSLFMVMRDTRMANTLMGSENGVIESVKVHDNYFNGTDIIDVIFASFEVQTPVEPKKGADCNNENTECYMPTPSAISVVGEHSMLVDGECPMFDADGFYQECFKKNDLVIISDGTNSNFLTITQDPQQTGSAFHLQHNPKGDFNVPANKNWPEGGYRGGSKIFKVKYLSYRIMETIQGHPSLSYWTMDYGTTGCDDPTDPACRIYQPVADNVEDLQIAVIFADGGIAYTAATDPNFVAGGVDNNFAAPDNDDTNDIADIRAIRITITARSDRTFPNYSGKRAAAENHEAGASDHYIRRTYTTEAKLRNFGLSDN